MSVSTYQDVRGDNSYQGYSQRNVNIAGDASVFNENMSTDPNAAPLEQNIKNLECNGVPYKIVKEEKPGQINVSSLFP